MGVLAMVELDGAGEQLLAALARVDELLPRPAGLELRLVATTESGVVLFQLWESAEARARNANDPAHRAALASSGLFEVTTAQRSRVFEHARIAAAPPAPTAPR
jgi:hypothetical protein